MTSRLKIINTIVLLINFLGMPGLLIEFSMIHTILIVGPFISAIGVAFQSKKFAISAIVFAVSTLIYAVTQSPDFSDAAVLALFIFMLVIEGLYIFDLYLFAKSE